MQYDLTGRRFGRLLVIRKTEKRNRNGNVMWLCHCDCGNDCFVSSRGLVSGETQSCGCLRIDRIKQEGKKRRNTKCCAVCGKVFEAPPSGRVTCSDKCDAVWRARQHKGKPHPWGEEPKNRLKRLGQTANLTKGTAAAMKSPNSGRFETNVSAKFWRVKSPEGRIYEFTNLLLWARSHCELFGKPPGDRSASIIAHGFYQAASAIRGTKGHHTMTYKDWRILAIGANVRNK